MFKKQKNRKGFVAIETIIAMTPLLILIILAIGIFLYLYPRIMLQIDVHQLANQAKIQGGLTDEISQPTNSDIALMKQKLQSEGYQLSDIEITATTLPNGLNAIGVDPLNQPGSNYIKRDSKEIIKITVAVPTQQFLKGPLAFMAVNTTNVATKHSLTEYVMSERW